MSDMFQSLGTPFSSILDILFKIFIASLIVTIILSLRVFIATALEMFGFEYHPSRLFYVKKVREFDENYRLGYSFFQNLLFVFFNLLNFLIFYWLFITICSATYNFLNLHVPDNGLLKTLQTVSTIFLLSFFIFGGYQGARYIRKKLNRT